MDAASGEILQKSRISLRQLCHFYHHRYMPFLSTDLYIQSQSGLSIEQIAAQHSIRPQEVEDRIEAARLFFEVQLMMHDFPFELLRLPFAKPVGLDVHH